MCILFVINVLHVVAGGFDSINLNSGESGKFRVMDRSNIEIIWANVISEDLKNIDEIVFYQNSRKIGSVNPQSSNKPLLLEHNICLVLKDFSMETLPQRKGGVGKLPSEELTYRPPSYKEVKSKQPYFFISSNLYLQDPSILHLPQQH